MDEATAALDAENQHVIAETLARLRGRCTLVVIAHQLSTVAMADQIVVLEDGRVVEQGAPPTCASAGAAMPSSWPSARRPRAGASRRRRSAALMRLRLSLLLLALSCASVLIGARQMEWRRLFSMSGDAWLTLTPAGCRAWRRWC